MRSTTLFQAMLILNAAVQARSLKTGTLSESPRPQGAVSLIDATGHEKPTPDPEPWHIDPSNCVNMKDHLAAVEERRIHGHHLFAALLICVMLTVNISFAMATSKNKKLSKNTWTSLGALAVVIIATSLYNAVAHLFEHLSEGYVHYAIALHILWAVILFFFAVYGSYSLRNHKSLLSAFNAVIFWVVLLAKGGAFSETQRGLGTGLQEVFLITLAGVACFALLMFVTHHLKPADGETWYDDVEASLAGGALAGGFVTMVDILIRGVEHEDPGNPWGNQEHAIMHKAFAFATCVAAVVLTPLIGKMKKNTTAYWYGRFLAVLNDFIGILPYFTVSLGVGGVLCHYLEIHPDSMMAKLTHTMCSTAIGALMIVICAFTPYLQSDNEEIVSLTGLILGFGGYIAGAGWANLFTTSVYESMAGHGYSEQERDRHTIALVFVLNLVFVPVFVQYMQPVLEEKTA